MIRGLIFDFDGLILDTEMPEFQAWQAIYRAHDTSLSLDTWAVCIGTGAEAFDPVAELERQIGRAVDGMTIHGQHKQHSLAMIQAERVRPGVETSLNAARQRGMKLAVASTSSCEWVTGNLERLGLLDRFDAIRGSDDVEHVKPAPDLYLAALDALGLAADEAIAFEDSPNGVWAARRAGIFTVAVPNALTALLNLDHADLRIASLADLPLCDLLAEVARRRAAG
jgi:HAD superfamily hydrolase (TIGR01509 family)